jgi:hypothetical protein
MPNQLKDVEIFSVGTWTGNKKVVVTQAMLDEMVQNFHSINQVPGFGVPIKLGHRTSPGDPAYGWMTDVRTSGGKLTADFDDVPEQTLAQIKKRNYNSVSIELMPRVDFSGKTYTNVLCGVALLGTEWPAVKGLRPLSASNFAEYGHEVVIELDAKEATVPDQFNQSQVDAFVLAAETRVRAEFKAQIDELNGKLTTSQEARTLAETALAAFRKDNETAAFTSVIDQAVKDGKILPKNRAVVEAVAAQFAGKTEKVKVGDKSYSPLELFKQYVDTMPKAVSFGESGTGEQGEQPGSGGKAQAEVMAKAKAFMAANAGKTFEQACDAVLNAPENAELKQRYADGE